MNSDNIWSGLEGQAVVIESGPGHRRAGSPQEMARLIRRAGGHAPLRLALAGVSPVGTLIAPWTGTRTWTGTWTGTGTWMGSWSGSGTLTDCCFDD